METSGEKRLWRLAVYVHATDAEVEDVAERVGAALCPDPSHQGYCQIPWATETTQPSGAEARFWEQHFVDERAAAEAAGDGPTPPVDP